VFTVGRSKETLDEIGRQLGLCGERARQIREDAKRRLVEDHAEVLGPLLGRVRMKTTLESRAETEFGMPAKAPKKLRTTYLASSERR